jgi:hypothetical protein
MAYDKIVPWTMTLTKTMKRTTTKTLTMKTSETMKMMMTKMSMTRTIPPMTMARTTSCLPSLNQLPCHQKGPQKEPRVEKITSSISEKLKITTPPFKPSSLMTLDRYMVKPFTQKMLILLRLIFTLQACYRSMNTRWN